jgi:hypothetical protein
VDFREQLSRQILRLVKSGKCFREERFERCAVLRSLLLFLGGIMANKINVRQAARLAERFGLVGSSGERYAYNIGNGWQKTSRLEWVAEIIYYCLRHLLHVVDQQIALLLSMELYKKQ